MPFRDFFLLDLSAAEDVPEGSAGFSVVDILIKEPAGYHKLEPKDISRLVVSRKEMMTFS